MKNINELLKSKRRKILLAAYPHPDDETMASGGLILAAKKAGWRVVVVTLTRGGAGKIYIKVNGRSLKEVREDELREAVRKLDADKLILMDYDDGRVRYDRKKWAKQLQELIREYRPGMVVTYDPSGFTGHPDHISVSQEILKIFQSRGTGFDLLFAAIPPPMANRTFSKSMEATRDNRVVPTHQLDLGWKWIDKWRAARAHKSQGLGKNIGIPLWLFMAAYRKEYYHLADKKGKYNYKFVDFEF